MVTRPTSSHPRLRSLIAAALALAFSAVAAAQSVQFQFSQRETWVGSPAVLTITVRDGDQVADPVLPKVDGLSLQLQPGRSTMSSMQFVNGRMSKEDTTTLTVLITPLRAGVFTVPPISMTVDGTNHASDPTTISSVPSTTGDLLKVEVTAEPTQAWVGQSVHAVLRIMVKPFRSPAHRVTLDEADMWRFIDGQRTQFGPFQSAMAELQQRGQRPMGHEELVGTTSYLVYEISTPFTAGAAGTPQFADVQIAWNYPTQLGENRGFFGQRELAVSATKPITALAETRDFVVRPLPEEGRPASFTGAIGEFTLDASAKPLRVGVGDPITLTLTVTDRGDGRALSHVQPPPLDTPELARDFRMPTAPLAGTIAGRTKTFTQSLRPVRQGIDRIPGVEFSWFDPITGRYGSAQSAPIPITVVPSEHLSTQAVLGGTATLPQPTQLQSVSEGLLANIEPTLAVVSDGRVGLLSMSSALILLGPPVLCAGVLFAKRRREKLAGDESGRRIRGARRGARERLATGDPAAALAGFIADHANRPHGTLTRDEVREILRHAGAPSELLNQVDRTLAQAERSRFMAPGGVASESLNASEVEKMLDALGRLSWSASRKGEGSSRS
jgi:hypothetical protein